jgi:uncharacterized protein (TIGR04255 family)
MAYERPPITEAVIELRFAQAFPQTAIEDAAKRVRDEYFYQDPENMVQFTIGPTSEKSAQRVAWNGIKLSSLDRADVLMFRTNSFVCSRLAPYPGWDAFRARASRGWNEWKRVAGTPELARIGVRYVNRIDVPLQNNPLIRIEDYLNLFPRLPHQMPEPMAGYTMQVVTPLEPGNYTLTLSSSSIPSPLIGFASFVLDLDVAREGTLPRRDDEIWKVLEEIRVHKNRVFEYCVTDQSRGLFSK